jgi:hypothetical protein
MGVNQRSALHPRWTRFASPTLRGFTKAKIRIIQPESASGAANYNPWTNHTSSTPITIWEGYATMDVFRQTLYAELPAGSITQIRSIRFTVPNADIASLTTPIRKGHIVKVFEVAEGTDQEIAKYQYTITSAIGGVNNWGRDIEAEADQGVVLNG